MNRKEFLIISITVFLTLIAWITADIYHEFLKGRASASFEPPPVVKNYQLNQFDQAIQILKQKKE